LVYQGDFVKSDHSLTQHDAELQLWVIRVAELKQQIIEDETKAQALVEAKQQREDELKKEVDRRQRDIEAQRETLATLFDHVEAMCSLVCNSNFRVQSLAIFSHLFAI
jgi:hypothetical protein